MVLRGGQSGQAHPAVWAWAWAAAWPPVAMAVEVAQAQAAMAAPALVAAAQAQAGLGSSAVSFGATTPQAAARAAHLDPVAHTLALALPATEAAAVATLGKGKVTIAARIWATPCTQLAELAAGVGTYRQVAAAMATTVVAVEADT